MRVFFVVAVLAVFFAWTRPVEASFEGYVEVLQPFAEEEGDGWEIHPVLYATYSYGPGQAAELTCKANVIMTDYGVENRNLANLGGLESRVETTESMVGGEMALDTMRVILDVRRAVAHSTDEEGLSQLIDYTGRCLLANTARTGPQPRVLIVEVKGPRKYATIAGRYRIDKQGSTPRLVRVGH